MRRYLFVIVIIVYFTVVESACTQPTKFYLDCSSSKTLSDAIQTCTQYGMTLVNLTNSLYLTNDIIELNQTLVSANCTGYFWFSSRNGTGYVASSSSLGNTLTGLITGTLNLVFGVLANLLGLPCIVLCPVTTTPAPITQAAIVCTRSIQQQVIQKCSIQSGRSDMRTFQFSEQQMYGGVLDSFVSRSRTSCSSQCSNDNQCNGISYINDICTLYI